MAKEQIKRFISSSSCIVQKGGSSSCSHSSSSSSSAGDADSSSNNNKNGNNRCRGVARCSADAAQAPEAVALASGTSYTAAAAAASTAEEQPTTKKAGKAHGRKMSLQWTKMKLLKAFQHHQSQKQAMADATNPSVAMALAKQAVRRRKDAQFKTPKRIETELESRFSGKENKDVQAVCCIYQATPAGYSFLSSFSPR